MNQLSTDISGQRLSRSFRESLKELRELRLSQGKSSKGSKFTIEAKSSVLNNDGSSEKNTSDKKKVSDVSSNLARKKRIEPMSQPQLITIQSLYDKDDEVTVHPLNLPTNWKNYDLNARKLKRENSSLTLQINSFMNKQSLSVLMNHKNYNLHPTKLLPVVAKKNHPMKDSNLKANNKLAKSLNVKTKSDSTEEPKTKSYESDPRYMAYCREWDNVLLKLKRKHETKWKTGVPSNAKLEDFELKQTLGNGSYGTVLLCKHVSTNVHYAIKCLRKKSVVKSKQIAHTIMEKKILSCINFPFITSLVYSFKDNANLYMVLPFVAGGEMFAQLHRVSRFSEALTKFYVAQIVLGVEYLHSLDIIHRDLKPENTLINADGYIKISDFGFAKHVPGKTYTLCGTPEYFAPEMIKGKAYGKSVDWWAVGVLTYEISTKEPPFQHSDQLKLYEKILNARLKLPPYLSDDVKDFMHCLINTDCTKRYGTLKNGVHDIKTHKWFAGTDWMKIYEKKAKVPSGIPKLQGPNDTSRFDKCKNFEIATSDENLYEFEFKSF